MPGSISSKGQTPRSQTPDLRAPDSSRLPADNGMRENIKVSLRIRPLRWGGACGCSHGLQQQQQQQERSRMQSDLPHCIKETGYMRTSYREVEHTAKLSPHAFDLLYWGKPNAAAAGLHPNQHDTAFQHAAVSCSVFACHLCILYLSALSEKESSRGDRAVWGSDGTGGVGLLSAAGDKLDVKFAYDVVFDAGNTNEHVGDLWQHTNLVQAAAPCCKHSHPSPPQQLPGISRATIDTSAAVAVP